MAGEILYAGLGNLTTVEVLSGKILLLLADRNGLPGHPAIRAGYQGDVAKRGSTTLSVPHVGIYGYDLQATGAEGVASANTPLSDGNSTINVVIKDKVYEAGDVARIIDATGVVNSDTFAVDAVVTASATRLSMLANLTDGFTATVTNSGVAMTLRNFLDAKATLTLAAVQGPYLADLYPTQWSNVVADLALAGGGAINYHPGNAELMDKMTGLGFQGQLFGVDVWTAKAVPTANAGADSAGGMFGAGAIIWADGTMVADPGDSNQVVLGGEAGGVAMSLLYERIRNGRAGLTAWRQAQLIGMSIGINAAGVSIINDR